MRRGGWRLASWVQKTGEREDGLLPYHPYGAELGCLVRFYQEVVGLPMSSRYPVGPDTEIAFLGDGATKVELICYKNQPEAVIGNGVALGFKMASVPEKFADMEGGGIPAVSQIIESNPHVHFFFATDPEGLKAQFIEHV